MFCSLSTSIEPAVPWVFCSLPRTDESLLSQFLGIELRHNPNSTRWLLNLSLPIFPVIFREIIFHIFSKIMTINFLFTSRRQKIVLGGKYKREREMHFFHDVTYWLLSKTSQLVNILHNWTEEAHYVSLTLLVMRGREGEGEATGCRDITNHRLSGRAQADWLANRTGSLFSFYWADQSTLCSVNTQHDYRDFVMRNVVASLQWTIIECGDPQEKTK